MRAGSNIVGTVNLGFNEQASNPFLHTYHPDHDNLDASFKTELTAGTESYGVSRVIALTFTRPGGDFESLTRGSATLNGNYAEVVTFLGKPGAQRSYTARGAFTLNQITDTPTLTR
jgi:hypothetical protein